MPGVRRIEGQRGSFIDPELEQCWSDLGKLRWLLAVVQADSGLSLRIAHYADDDTFGIFGHGHSLGAVHYAAAWRTISDLGLGARMFRDDCPTRACGDPA